MLSFSCSMFPICPIEAQHSSSTLRAGAGRAHQLAALAALELDVVDRRSEGDPLERQAAADHDVRLGRREDLAPDRQAHGGEDVAPLAVRVADERDVRGAVRIVLDRLHLPRHPVLVAAEVDHPVALLVAAAPVAHREQAAVVPASGAVVLLEQGLVRRVRRRARAHVLRLEARPRARRLVDLHRHRRCLPRA
jgi:hypothetical protein